MCARSYRLSPSLPSLVFSALFLALSVGVAAAAQAPAAVEPAADRGPSAWLDGAWVPLDAASAPEDAAPEASVAFQAAGAAATEGSQIHSMLPLLHADGSAQRAMFVAVVDGESCLWSTDGTAAGTFRVEPAGECMPVSPHLDSFFVGVADGVAYFVGGNFTTLRYWRSDGTSAGTWPLTGFFDEDLEGRLFNLVAVPPLGLVVFTADDGVHGAEPWVSDGSPEGAALLADTSTASGGFVPFFYRAVGSRVFFFVWRGGVEGGVESELWVTDGTPAGTRLVKTVGTADFPGGPRFASAAGDRLVFFLGSSHSCVGQLWTSDGTAAGTRAIRSFDGLSCVAPGQFRAAAVEGFPGQIFFAADDGVHGGELWRTDGTVGGTVRLTDFAPEQPFPSGFLFTFGQAGLAGEIFFAADDGTHGMELWKSDGTPGGAELVADLCPGACSPGLQPPIAVGARVVFSAATPDAGRELWATDGTASGTERVTDLCAGTCSATIFREVAFGESLLFIADDGTHGEEWWIFTPPTGPAARLTDLAPAQPFNPLLEIATLTGRAVFAAHDGEHGREPWVTDGTPAGTHLLADLETTEIPPPPEPPAAPANLQIDEIDGGRVFLSWEDRSNDETGFRIEILRGDSPNWESASRTSDNVTRIEGQFGTGTFDLRVRAIKSDGVVVTSDPSNEVTATVGGFCSDESTELCLGDDRFTVRVLWRNQHAPFGEVNSGAGQAVPAGGGVDDSGYFWFFTPDNLELVVKVLDGTSVNGHFWVFWGALSDVEYSIAVEDTVTGEQRRYDNPPGQICGGSDTAAFQPEGDGGGFARAGAAAGGERPAPPAPAPFAVASGPATRFLAVDAPAAVTGALHPEQPCVADDETLCLLDGMLAVTVDWTDHHNGGSGVGRARPYTDLTGFFWFFHPENVELVVKALDGRTVNGKIWVFYGALTDVGYTLRVENRADGHAVRNYVNPPGTICGKGDTAAF